MLGSRAEADDALQEAWLRLSRADLGGVENLGGWLTTVVVARVPDDARRAPAPPRGGARGGRLPDPVVAVGADPSRRR